MTDEEKEWHEFAEELFKAYCRSVDFKDYRGDPLPAWKDVRPNIQLAWVAVAKAAAERYVC